MMPLETNYLRIYLIDLHQTLRIGRHIVEDDQSDIRFVIAEGKLLS